jgi:hypothetical protein
MGFACPVCGDPQADAGHLANHLAFTALMRGGDHEAFLDEHVPDWERLDESGLGDRVAEHAEETAFPQVFEDTTDHDHDDGRHRRRPDARTPDGAFGAETRDVLEEARELTRERHGTASDAGPESDSETE